MVTLVASTSPLVIAHYSVFFQFFPLFLTDWVLFFLNYGLFSHIFIFNYITYINIYKPITKTSIP